MDFFNIITKQVKKGCYEIFTSYKTNRPKDLMVRGKAFYAVWDESTGLWTTNEQYVIDIVDDALRKAYNALREREPEASISVKYLSQSHTGGLRDYRSYILNQSDDFYQLDTELTFQNTETTIDSYASKRLPYSLKEGDITAYEEIISTLYDPIERRKLEWAIGAIIAGDGKYIEKFIAIYGPPGSGKGTILKIIQKLFQGYYISFDAKALVSHNNTFGLESFKHNPLVAIQEDGDLSKIEDNTKLNSLVSHEELVINEKYKSAYSAKINSFLFMGTNSNIKITESKAGIIRRLVNASPSGRLIPVPRFRQLEKQIDFELGAIAYHCLKVYNSLGRDFYHDYRPTDMILRTNHFYNFINDNLDEFIKDGGITLLRAYTLYKEFCAESSIEYPLQKFKFRDELKNYFQQFEEWARPPSEGGRQVKNWYSGFDTIKFYGIKPEKEYEGIESGYSDDIPDWLKLTKQKSILDKVLEFSPAQYSNKEGIPFESWDNVERNLSDINTAKEHYVRPPFEHIVVDFDLKDETGEKSLDLNIKAASTWKPTYTEISRSGKALHLHYIYDGDPEGLSPIFAPGIEVKVFKGKQALRRRLTLCNNLEIATISTGLPQKEAAKTMINTDYVQTEKSLRKAIQKGLRKEVHPSTKSSIDFICYILDQAYESGITYDVTDMIPKILIFANNSTNQSDYCVNKIGDMKFKSADVPENINIEAYDSDTLIFFDVEVFPNLFVICYKEEGEGKPIVKLINPSPILLEELFKYKLVGFNCRRYDNHILYAWYLGCTNLELYEVSKRLIDKNDQFNGYIEAYNISYTDIWCFNYNKQSLKKWEIELGIHHQELGLPWDEPVPEDKWLLVTDYCGNDVIATEAVFNANIVYWKARQVLAALSGLTVNDTTNSHSAKIVLEGDPNAKQHFVYTDLSEMFPGYTFDMGKSHYRNELVSEGGYIHSEPGVYGNVALLDVESMHPTSIIKLNMFGKYTANFKELVDTRLDIKHKNLERARKAFGGRIARFLQNVEDASDLALALKLAINSVYGLTFARFNSKFKDDRNIDNICAKRGALFMVDLKHAVQEKGFTVAHIKTDSIKIPDATPEIIDFVVEFGKKYGYNFEHEATYDRFCLFNDSTYVCREGSSNEPIFKDNKYVGPWAATGTQMIQPYTFKTLFSKESITLKDYTETKNVNSPAAIYLDFNEKLGENEHNYVFVGRTGAFCPVIPGSNGGVMVWIKEGGNPNAVTGTKGYRWLEAEVVYELYDESIIEVSYYRAFVDKAIKDIENWCLFDWFISDKPYHIEQNGILPF